MFVFLDRCAVRSPKELRSSVVQELLLNKRKALLNLLNLLHLLTAA